MAFTEKRQSLFTLGVLSLVYCLAVFPLLFFRHDDWWILGNSVRYLPQNWHFLWKPTLYHSGQEIIWFLRPGFKLLVLVFYSVFGLNYFLWMATLLGFFLAALWLGFLTAVRVSASPRNGFWFLVVAAASFPLHFGSLAWMGEGMMNVPQLFFLLLCTYTLCRAWEEQSLGWAVSSWLSFLVALGFKESSLFHVAFLAGVCGSEPFFRRRGLRAIGEALVPFAVIAAIYLAIRLGRMPYNPSYVAVYSWFRVTKTLSLALAPILLPVFLWGVSLYLFGKSFLFSYVRQMRSWLFFVPFLACSLVLYVGQDFFSPGWLLVVGICTVFLFSLRAVPDGVGSRAIGAFALALFLVSSVPVIVRLQGVGWWRWRGAQQEFFELLRSVPEPTRQIFIRACENAQFPGVVFERVVANAEGVRQMTYLLHGKEIPTYLLHCGTPIPSGEGQLILDWRFPQMEKIEFRL
jgi:hypothetical protein